MRRRQFRRRKGNTVVERDSTERTGNWRRFYSEHRFSVLLVIVLALLAGPPLLFGFGLPGSWFDGAVSLLMLAAILSLCFEPRQRYFALFMGVPTVLLSLGGHTISGTSGSEFLFAGHICEVFFLFGAAALIVRALFSQRSIRFDSICGSVCGYLFLGLGWAVLYAMLEGSQPGSFQISPSLMTDGDPARPHPHVLTYYSFVTLTTVGYGDISPIAPAARTFAWIEAISGQFYLAVIVAGLVSVLVSSPKK